MDDFLPAASRTNLELRAALLKRVRAFFDSRGFLEVETPILSHDVVVDQHIDPLSVVLFDDPRQPEVGERLWLQTSPEFGMKRLLAAGMEAIYQVTRAFRGGEIGRLHNPEFTMVEWYRAGDDMTAGMTLLSDLCTELLNLPAAELLSYASAFERHVGVDPHRASIDELRAAAKRLGVSIPEGLHDDRDEWLNLLLAMCVEPHLGRASPAILYDYPATQAALARVRRDTTGDDTPIVARGSPDSAHAAETGHNSIAVAERFELYVNGIELANGYHELLDPAVLRERNRVANAARVADGKPALAEESRLLQAMESGLPACTGVALGFDRVVMLAAGAASLEEVMAFPIQRA